MEILACIITYKDSFTTMISFAFYDELLSNFFKDFYEVNLVTRIRKNSVLFTPTTGNITLT